VLYPLEHAVTKEEGMSVATAGEVAFFDLFDPSFRVDSPAVHAARAANWYARTPLGFAVLRYEAAQAFLRERRLRQGGMDSLLLQGVSEGPLVDWWRLIILNVEGETHARLRRLVGRAFTPRNLERLRPRMWAVAGELIDALADQAACDFVEAFADPYPIRVIGELLGVADEDYPQFTRWSHDLGLAFGLTVAQDLERIEAGLEGLYGYADELLARRRAAPGDDLVSQLIAAEEAGDRLSDDELRAMVVALVFAGHDTTRNQLGWAMHAFLEHPEQWGLLASQPSLATRAVEEVMRLHPTVPAITRVAVEDVTYEGVTIPAGSYLSIFVGAANTDPAVFGDATFDITVERPAQLGFGGGVHYCLGAWLARTEMAEALPLLAARLRNPRPAGPASWRPSLGITGPVRLPISFAVE
jgi:cytochrome P450